MKTIFLGQTCETGQILPKKEFPPQNEPHTAKLSFSGVLKHFGGNLLKNFFCVKIVTISERSEALLRIFFHITSLKRANPEERFKLFGNKFFW